MARIRSYKPEYWSSEQVMDLPRDARLLFLGIWSFSDDAGRFKWNPRTIKAQVLPGDDDVTAADVEQWLSLIAQCGLIERYVIDGCAYGAVTGWEHQKINRPQPAKWPAPPEKSDGHESFTDDSVNGQCERTDGSTLRGSTLREGGARTVTEPHEQTTVDLLRDDHKRRYVERKDMPPSMGAGYAQHLKTAARWCDEKAALDGVPVAEVVRRLLDGFFASQNPRVVGDWGMRFLGTDPSEFYPSSKPSQPADPSWRKRPQVKHDPTPRPRHRPARGTA